jgi:hypothetical protein
MSTIKSSDEHLTLNADGSSKDIKFQANGVEKASISSAGAFTSTTIDATKLTGALPAIDGSNLTGVTTPTTYMAATGGTITTDGDYKVHSFNSSGTFTVTTLGTEGTVEYLIVAGGGAGGSHAGGGAGAGGVLMGTNKAVTAQAYTITVGAGGGNASNGSNSSALGLTAIGGGRGCDHTPFDAGSGGSGGGATFILSNSTGVAGAGTMGQGNRGGYVRWQNTGNHASAGGGGAGDVGETPYHPNDMSGNGGRGAVSYITGSRLFFGGGGGGACHTGHAGHGGIGGGGGGACGTTVSGSATGHSVGIGGGQGNNDGGTPSNTAGGRGGAGGANTGGGGGGGSVSGRDLSGLGGSGIVVIRYRFQA